MELVFDVVGIHQYEPGLISNKSFTETGGVIGRAGHCDWIIPDSKRIISGEHARISYQDGAFFLTDISSNGIRVKDGRSEEHTSELQSRENLVCRLLLEKKKYKQQNALRLPT